MKINYKNMSENKNENENENESEKYNIPNKARNKRGNTDKIQKN